MSEPVKDTPKWIAETELVSVVLPPPPMVLKYAGGQRVDVEEQYEYCLSDASLENISRAGATLVWLHFFNGFGLEFEKQEMERSRDFTRRAHARGLKAAFRLTLGSLTPETLLLEEPESHNWLQVNHDGQLCGGGSDGRGHTFRARPCLNSEAYLRYIERVCNFAIDCGADLIHFDDTGYNPEPDTCHCPLCVTAFREFLRRQYGTENEQTKQAGHERFAHNTFIHARPPVYSTGPLNAEAALESPHQQEWTRFKVHTVTQTLARLAHAIAKRNPACAIGADLLRDGAANSDIEWAVNYGEQIPLVHAILAEPEVPADGAAFENLITLLKIARMFKVRLQARPAGIPLDLRFAANLAFGRNGVSGLGALGIACDPEFSSASSDRSKLVQSYLDFQRQNAELLGAAAPLSVAVFRDTPSLAFGGYLCQNEVEIALQDNHVSFDLLFAGEIGKLGAYRCVVLPNPRCLSDAIAKALEGYVNAGGGLLIVDDPGSLDPWGRRRSIPALQPLLENAGEEQGGSIRRQVGQGRVAYCERSQMLPAGYAEAVAYAANEETACAVTAESGKVVVECRLIRGGASAMTLAIHAINAGESPARGLNFSVLCRTSAQKVVPLSPGGQDEPIPFTCDNDRLIFSYDELERYILFRVDF